MSTEEIHLLIEQFRRFDAELAPIGLYATAQEEIWSKVLYPLVKRDGGKVTYARPGRSVHFTDGGGREGKVELLFFSAVKVRKFGNRFATDARIDYHDRWNDRRIQKKLCDIWAADNDERRIFVIVGFDRGEAPFRREFERLAQEIDWEPRGVIHAKEAWSDPSNRGFSCIVAVWERS